MRWCVRFVYSEKKAKIVTKEKTSVLSLRINDDLKKKIEQSALQKNQTTTEYVKDLLLNSHLSAVVSNTDQKIEDVERRAKDLEKKTTEALAPLLKNLGIAKEMVDILSRRAEKTAENLEFSRWELIWLAMGSGISMGVVLAIVIWIKF